MSRQLGLLIGLTVLVWVLLAIPARRLVGDEQLNYSAVALALCLVPTSATLAWSHWAFRQSAEQQLMMVLGGSGVRVFVVLGVALALHEMIPYFQRQSGFWGWILFFYLFTLALEMTLLVRGHAAEERHGA